MESNIIKDRIQDVRERFLSGNQIEEIRQNVTSLVNERLDELMNFRVTKELLDYANQEVLFMHCLPADKGQEATQKTFEDKRCVALQEAENRMHLQKSILRWCTGLF